MSSAVVSASAARGRAFVFDEKDVAEVCPQPSGKELFGEGRPPQRVASSVFPVAGGTFSEIFRETFKDTRLAGVMSASRLAVRPEPEMVSSGIAAMDALTGGLPRGCLTEVCGPASSGRTALLLAALATATRRGEFCAVVDASDALDPQSVAAAGMDMERLLWVRCGESSSQRERSPRRHPSTSLRAGSDMKKESSQINQDSDRVRRRVGSRTPKSLCENSLDQVLRATDL